jgi:hypothetical protein
MSAIGTRPVLASRSNAWSAVAKKLKCSCRNDRDPTLAEAQNCRAGKMRDAGRATRFGLRAWRDIKEAAARHPDT